MNRSTSLDRIQSAGEPFDVLIIGGGASGLGAAVDAAARGHSVALFEQSDFAKGTSSRSTKLVHGGVRYLQQGNISLVLEALRERGRLTKNAPHLVGARAFVIPNYSWWEGPFYGIGMKVYDQLAGKLGLAPSSHLDRQQTLDRIPTVNPEHLVGGVVYHDGQFDDSRLAMNLAQTAEELGAAMVNYCRCTGLVKEHGRVRGLELKDMESGREFTVRGRSVINATGIFVDEVRRRDDPQAQNIIQVSQGVHIVLPGRFLPGDAAIMIPKTADGRVLFAVPWHDCVVVGTTDTPVEEKSLEPRALEEERAFVMEHACKYLSPGPGADDVLSIFAGLRPLVKPGGGSDTAAISREHTVMVSGTGLITLTGGKWTTYRKMAEDVIDQAETLGGLDRRRCPTRDLRIHGCPRDGDRPDTGGRPSASTGPDLESYGSDAVHIRDLINVNPGLGDKVHPCFGLLRAEVIWQVREEMARTVEDVLARRSRCLLLNARASIDAAPAVARLMAGELGRDEPWIETQVADYRELAAGYVF